MATKHKNPEKSNAREKIIPIRVNKIEHEAIATQAKKFGLTSSNFLRSIGMNYPVKSIVDEQAVAALLKVNADMGRLGGLLKMWLVRNSGDKEAFSKQRSYKDIDVLMDEIEALQKTLKAEALKIMKSK